MIIQFKVFHRSLVVAIPDSNNTPTLPHLKIGPSLKQKTLRVAILTPNPFPVGNVATNRLSTYALAMARHGHDTRVYVLKGTENPMSPVNCARLGTYNGVIYEYMSATPLWDTAAPKHKKILLYLQGIGLCMIRLARERPTCILMYTNDFFYMVGFAVYAKLLGVRYVIDKSEYPIVYYNEPSISRSLYLAAFRLFDGILVMTHELRDYYRSLASSRSRVYLLPMTVDLDRFRDYQASEEKSVPSFVSVFGTHNRDCIMDTIAAFEICCSRYKLFQVKLILIGDIDRLINGREVKDCVAKSTVRNNIVLRGPALSSAIPDLLKNATALITTPRSYKSGGFPTKVGEYLATGNPVIITNVGELGIFLRDNENCLMTEPGCTGDLADKMEFVLRHPDAAKEIGSRGRALAERAFNMETYMESFVQFLRG